MFSALKNLCMSPKKKAASGIKIFSLPYTFGLFSIISKFLNIKVDSTAAFYICHELENQNIHFHSFIKDDM